MAQARRPASITPPPQGPEDALPPEEPTPEIAPETPAGTTIRIGGRDFTVEPELAAAYEAREADFARGIERQGRELGELRSWRQRVEQQLQPKPTADEWNYNTMLFERPQESLDRFGRSLEDRITEKLTQQYSAVEQQRRNWESFYKRNPDLVDEDRFVKAIATELMGTWSRGDDVQEFLEEVAKQTRTELLRISRKTREADSPSERLPRGRTPVEGGGNGRQAPAPEAPEEPLSLSSEILRHQQRRRNRAVAE